MIMQRFHRKQDTYWLQLYMFCERSELGLLYNRAELLQPGCACPCDVLGQQICELRGYFDWLPSSF